MQQTEAFRGTARKRDIAVRKQVSVDHREASLDRKHQGLELKTNRTDGKQNSPGSTRTSPDRKRVETVVETLATLHGRGETLAEVAHEARNMVTALGLYCDLLEEPGVLATPSCTTGTSSGLWPRPAAAWSKRSSRSMCRVVRKTSRNRSRNRTHRARPVQPRRRLASRPQDRDRRCWNGNGSTTG